MDADQESARQVAKRAYELGRLRTAVLRAVAVAALVAGAAAITVSVRRGEARKVRRRVPRGAVHGGLTGR